MNRNQEVITLLSLIVGIVACIGGWIAFPPIERYMESLMANQGTTPLPTLISVATTSTRMITSTPTPDCSFTIELGPWPSPTEVSINPNRDSWVQADFWTSDKPLKEGYDEVSVIFEPSLRVNISQVAGIGWKYDRRWSEEDVEWCTTKHIRDSWDIRRKKLALITPTELCSIVRCY